MGKKSTRKIAGQISFFNMQPAASVVPGEKVKPLPAVVNGGESLTLFDMLKDVVTERPIAEKQPDLSIVPPLEKATPKNYSLPVDASYPLTPLARYQGNITAIRLMKKIEGDYRTNSPEEQAILAEFTGWGGLADFFDEEKQPERAKELKGLLMDGEYRAALHPVGVLFKAIKGIRWGENPPRACGEQAVICAALLAGTGSPPRMRGVVRKDGAF